MATPTTRLSKCRFPELLENASGWGVGRCRVTWTTASRCQTWRHGQSRQRRTGSTDPRGKHSAEARLWAGRLIQKGTCGAQCSCTRRPCSLGWRSECSGVQTAADALMLPVEADAPAPRWTSVEMGVEGGEGKAFLIICKNWCSINAVIIMKKWHNISILLQGKKW